MCCQNRLKAQYKWLFKITTCTVYEKCLIQMVDTQLSVLVSSSNEPVYCFFQSVWKC